jgi:Suppressor of fused protein (SUFU)
VHRTAAAESDRKINVIAPPRPVTLMVRPTTSNKLGGGIVAKSSNADFGQQLLHYLATVAGSPPQILDHKRWGGRVRVARCADYPRTGRTTFVTLGASQLRVSIYRGRPVGFEMTLTLAKEDPCVVETLGTAVVENLEIAAADERRPFIEYNGIYAPGYPPHLLFTTQITDTPALSDQKRVGDNYVTFLAAIPLDDREVREYDRSVTGLIEMIRRSGRVAEYPRKGKARRATS